MSRRWLSIGPETISALQQHLKIRGTTLRSTVAGHRTVECLQYERSERHALGDDKKGRAVSDR